DVWADPRHPLAVEQGVAPAALDGEHHRPKVSEPWSGICHTPVSIRGDLYSCMPHRYRYLRIRSSSTWPSRIFPLLYALVPASPAPPAVAPPPPAAPSVDLHHGIVGIFGFVRNAVTRAW